MIQLNLILCMIIHKFSLGKNVNVEITHANKMILQSSIDNTSMILSQLEEVSSYDLFNGSNDPTRGWRSEYFNQATAYYKYTSTE